MASSLGSVSRLWSKKMPGLITDLNVTPDGNTIVISTIPDPDQESEANGFQVSRVDSGNGNILWSYKSGAQIKAQGVASNGSLIVLSNYNEEIIGLDIDGKILWQTQGTCRPVILTPIQKIVCYHDDDAAPGTAFDVLDWSGKKLLSYPASSDILVLKSSSDEKRIAIGLTRGQVILFNEKLKVLWTKQVPGEILDLAVSSGDSPQVVVLFHSAKQGQKVSVFDVKGKTISTIPPSAHVEQIEMSPDGGSILLYGNSPKGQNLAFFNVDPSQGLQEKWHWGSERYADYSSSLSVEQGVAWIGFEDVQEKERQSHLLGFDFQGQVKWDIPLETEVGAYLYAHSYSSEKSLLGVGTDDAVLTLFRVKP